MDFDTSNLNEQMMFMVDTGGQPVTLKNERNIRKPLRLGLHREQNKFKLGVTNATMKALGSL